MSSTARAMARLKIDGKAVEAPEGKTILAAAESAGIKIPTLCHHPALEPFGACRICTVEVLKGKRKRLVTACNYPAEGGIEVETASERVVETRRWLLEALLARSPEAPLIRKLAREHGVEKARFKLEKEKCILCGLCVRVCGERMGRSAINFSGRGIERKIDTPFGLQAEECMACGACVSVCPTEAVDLDEVTRLKARPIRSEFDQGLKGRKPIYVPYPQAFPNVPAIDREKCVRFLTGECGICRDVCPAGAIDYERDDEVVEIEVGAVILAPGYDVFDARLRGEYGYGVAKNVLSSLDFERVLSASGPFQGEVKRPSDGRQPGSIAWIQCVGSRDEACGRGYCSSVCCMYSVKEAVMAIDHVPGLKGTIFYNDMRTFGKGYETYYNLAREKYGVELSRGIVSNVKELQRSKNLLVRSVSDGGRVEEREFEMAVLAVGIVPCGGTEEVARKLGVKLDVFGFAETSILRPGETSREGVYVAGVFGGPKDIPESVSEACSAAALAARDLAEARGTLVSEKRYRPEREVAGEDPRIGVFVCHCGTNIAGVVDVAGLAEYARSLHGVVHADHYIYTCSSDSQKKIIDVIGQERLNRVVVASCTPRTHEPLFQECLREAGLNKYLLEMANIREQCSWVHKSRRREANEKSRDLLRMAVRRAALLQPLVDIPMKVNQKALVIGGGASGMTAALSLASQRFETFLVEKSDKLGGMLRRMRFLAPGADPKSFLEDLVKRVEKEPRIKVYTGSSILDFAGHKGDFKTLVACNGKEVELEHGVVVVATGGEEYRPTEHLYGKSDRVMTQLELEEMMDTPDGRKKIGEAGSLVMIQCVGSREREHPYCSRVCCQQAVKNALQAKSMNRKLQVAVLYRDIRTYGLSEAQYRQAREMGVLFLRFDEERKPEVKEDGGRLEVLVHDSSTGFDLRLDPDYLVLGAAIRPNHDNDALGAMLKVPRNPDGFFLEAHMKLRPLDFTSEGIYLCGLAHGPKNLSDSIVQASGAAARAAVILSRKEMLIAGTVSRVEGERCVACLTCVRVCPYGAPRIGEKGVAEIEIAACRGCGSCAASCPRRAIHVFHYLDDQIAAKLEGLLE